MSLQYTNYNAAQKEFMALLRDTLVPIIYQHFHNLFQGSVKLAERIGSEQKKKLDSAKVFDMTLRDIPLWNSDVIAKETKRVDDKIPNLGDLLRAITLSSVRVMSTIRIDSDQTGTLAASTPSTQNFIHKVMSIASEDLEPWMFEAPISRQKKREAYSIIADSIPPALRSLINPLEILKDYLHDIGGRKEYTPPPQPLPSPAPRKTPAPSPAVSTGPVSTGPRKTPAPSPALRQKGLELRKELDKQDKKALGEFPVPVSDWQSSPTPKQQEPIQAEEEEEEEEERKIIHLPEKMLQYQERLSEKDIEKMLAEEEMV